MSDFNTLRLIEALLFASKDPVPTSVLAAQIPDDEDIAEILETLQSHYANRGIVLEGAGNAWAFRTASDLAGDLAIQRVASRRLSRARISSRIFCPHKLFLKCSKSTRTPRWPHLSTT